MKRSFPLVLVVAALWFASPALGGNGGGLGDYGDAPDGALAYPTLGVIGQFPTCVGGPAGFVFHAADPGAFFGPMVDFEGDGNGGICPQPPWDNDECSNAVDNDAGLTIPAPYTIAGGVETTCGLNGTPLGLTCGGAAWGANIDIRVTNNTGLDLFVNVLADWDQDGKWSGSSLCGLTPAPEWVLQNFVVPAGFVGALSALGPPGFLIGPNAGFCWFRFTICETPLPGPVWDGSGSFQFGESEDYLLRVDQAVPQLLEFGDAPEGALAYPALGVFGFFPTCLGGPAGVITHQQAAAGFGAQFGPGIDYEVDGNAGICPPPGYEQDECWGPVDGDAGLIKPDPYTIAGGVEVSCNGGNTTLGFTCTNATWGPDIDINVQNNVGTFVYVNVLADWDHSGTWGGASPCAVAAAPEWILQNFAVPSGFLGPLSTLGPPGFLIGPNGGFAWFRFTVSESPIGAPDWDGTGAFQLGETEDYLLFVKGQAPLGDYGDAPENALAYPSGVVGAFPTCVFTGPAGFVYHGPNHNCWLGPFADNENDGNAGVCVHPAYDQDECAYTTGDAGLITPEPYTFNAAGGVQPCPQLLGTPLGWRCLTESRIGVQLDVRVTNNNPYHVWLNILVDWNQDGQWAGSLQCPGQLATPEHLVQNVPVFAGFTGKLSDILSQSFWVPSLPGFVWTRITISDQPVPVNWDGSGSFQDGETEDYLLRVDDTVSGLDEPTLPIAGRVFLEPAVPNPFNPATTIAWRLAERGDVTLTIHDVTGRVVRTLVDGPFDAGRHQAVWDGTDDQGRALASGIYVVAVRSAGTTRTMKITMIK